MTLTHKRDLKRVNTNHGQRSFHFTVRTPTTERDCSNVKGNTTWPAKTQSVNQHGIPRRDLLVKQQLPATGQVVILLTKLDNTEKIRLVMQR